MTTMSNQISPGMTISIKGKVYRVENSVKVTVTKGAPFIKTTLKNLISDELIEKNFNLEQTVEEVTLSERRLEYLYVESKDYLFLDIDHLEEVLISLDIVGEKENYLKEGIQLKALFYGKTVFSIELPQFLELMVVKLNSLKTKVSVSNASQVATLETGANVEVPLFIEVGDIIKVDTHLGEYVQRI